MGLIDTEIQTVKNELTRLTLERNQKKEQVLSNQYKESKIDTLTFQFLSELNQIEKEKQNNSQKRCNSNLNTIKLETMRQIKEFWLQNQNIDQSNIEAELNQLQIQLTEEEDALKRMSEYERDESDDQKNERLFRKLKALQKKADVMEIELS